jgi:hypothetical protein
MFHYSLRSLVRLFFRDGCAFDEWKSVVLLIDPVLADPPLFHGGWTPRIAASILHLRHRPASSLTTNNHTTMDLLQTVRKEGSR